jgi:hypothetical protein
MLTLAQPTIVSRRLLAMNCARALQSARMTPPERHCGSTHERPSSTMRGLRLRSRVRSNSLSL